MENSDLKAGVRGKKMHNGIFANMLDDEQETRLVVLCQNECLPEIEM